MSTGEWVSALRSISFRADMVTIGKEENSYYRERSWAECGHNAKEHPSISVTLWLSFVIFRDMCSFAVLTFTVESGVADC